jgi:hypothetical protein
MNHRRTPIRRDTGVLCIRSTMAASTPTAAASTVRRLYRELYSLLGKTDTQKLQELRSSFRRPLVATERVHDRMQQAESRLSFLRMTSVSPPRRGRGGRWMYKDGERLSNVNGTFRDAKGRVVSNWDGSNLDPESLQRHKKLLNRAGFVNNAHAKGVF